jgi:hypothetical protein
MPKILNSVGRGGVNRMDDVKMVQTLINDNLPIPLRPLVVNGKADGDTIFAIEEFQRRKFGLDRPDGRVDPNGRTLKALLGELVAAVAPATSAGATTAAVQPFMDRVKAFQAHVKKEFNIEVGINSNTRDPVWQQRMHVAHMIKYNSFASRKPKKNKSINNRALIDFAHLKDAKVVWGGSVTPEEFLRDAQGNACKKKADGSGYEPEPDEAKTRERALELLKAAGVATAKDRASEPSSAMVAPGVQGCAEPCACGGNKSNHLAGYAVDLNRTKLDEVRQKLTPPTEAQLDKLLGEFKLHRPMASEPWHVEPKN